MATNIRRAAKRDPILAGLLVLPIGLIVSTVGMLMHRGTHSDISGLTVVVGLAIILFAFIVASFGLRRWKS